jgi:hypothetical protein
MGINFLQHVVCHRCVFFYACHLPRLLTLSSDAFAYSPIYVDNTGDGETNKIFPPSQERSNMTLIKILFFTVSLIFTGKVSIQIMGFLGSWMAER